jgi:hypothetical protein
MMTIHSPTTTASFSTLLGSCRWTDNTSAAPTEMVWYYQEKIFV